MKEVDWQYHLNNNGELDNGVYNKFIQAAQDETSKPIILNETLNESRLSYITPEEITDDVKQEAEDKTTLMGFPWDYLKQSLALDLWNHVTTTYNLLIQKILSSVQ